MDSNQTPSQGMAQRRRWRERQHLARLCDLVSGSLLPHLEPEPPATRRPELTREEERCVLLALSLVNRTIREWDDDNDNEVDDGDASDPIVSSSGEAHSCCLPSDLHFDDGFSCLANITSIVVGLHRFCSNYIKHSAGNILMAISNSLKKFEAVWIQFVELVWSAIHAVSTCCSHNHSTTDATNCSGTDPTCCSFAVENISHSTPTTSTSIARFVVVLKLRCVNISKLIMTSLFRVLHIILKFLKLSDSELKDDFICLSIHHIQKLSWDPGYQLIDGKIVSLVKDDRHSLSRDYAQFGIVSGSLLQLVCSLVEQSDMEDTGRRDIFVKLVDVIPRLVAFLQEQQDIPKSLSQYYKHKILMLMIRLKSHMQQNCSHIICLLKLFRAHFQNLLHEPMSQHLTKLENCLEGSPFLLSVAGVGEIQDKSTWHLQRQAMYLFLSCCILLACSGNNSRLQCSCKTDEFGHEVQGFTNHCNYFGLSEISDWFERCCLDKILDSKSSTDIVLCFLQLYMEEDDILFIILLQLLDAPLISLAVDNMETKWTSKLIGAKLFSIIFDPVHTFHLFLLLLHYDHLVLVDYLISKDVGVHCAQYLLRCLRLVSQCWNAFIDDSVYDEQIQNFTCKRQRTLKNINSFTGSSIQSTKLGCSRDKESKSKKQFFLSAKVCLLSLKRTLEDLHQKDLFPYNPKPLLKSLARFEELCEQC